MTDAKRKHRATGRKPPGGNRPGSGRPEGTPNVLPYGAVVAIEACGLRVPDGTPEDVALLADRALMRIADVMEERVDFMRAGHVLKAATQLRNEVCGPIAQKLEVKADDSFAELLKEARARAARED